MPEMESWDQTYTLRNFCKVIETRIGYTNKNKNKYPSNKKTWNHYVSIEVKKR